MRSPFGMLAASIVIHLTFAVAVLQQRPQDPLRATATVVPLSLYTPLSSSKPRGTGKIGARPERTNVAARGSRGKSAAAVDAANASGAPPAPAGYLSALYRNNEPPEYPVESRRRGEQGLVLLLIRPGASAVQVQLARSSGFHLLDEAALRSAQRWRYPPLPGPAGLILPVRFILDDV
jgi:protein TonB